ncbi:MAG: methylenetetrahydrofolate reductase C-terminal domain-containing protein [Deltaproteobacteria bacterium]
MIVGKLKPLDEIASSIRCHKNLLIVGCGSCVTVCLSGGEREAMALARELSNPGLYPEAPPTLRAAAFLRQCERDLVKEYLQVPPDTDAILSLACGAGVQTLASVFEKLPIIPALNTSFLGALDEPGVWREKCLGCGDCVLAHTAGICPIARCAKRLLNGPCGGSSKGKCEIGGDVDCAWNLIVDRLRVLDRLEDYEKLPSIKDWSQDRGGGPRSSHRVANAAFE